MAYATPADVGTRLMRSLSTVETAAATQFITDLSAELRLRIPGLDARLLPDADFAAVVKSRIAQAIANFFALPASGAVEETVLNITRRWATARAAGFAGLTAADWLVLLPNATQAASGVYTVPLGG